MTAGGASTEHDGNFLYLSPDISCRHDGIGVVSEVSEVRDLHRAPEVEKMGRRFESQPDHDPMLFVDFTDDDGRPTDWTPAEGIDSIEFVARGIEDAGFTTDATEFAVGVFEAKYRIKATGSGLNEVAWARFTKAIEKGTRCDVYDGDEFFAVYAPAAPLPADEAWSRIASFLEADEDFQNGERTDLEDALDALRPGGEDA